MTVEGGWYVGAGPVKRLQYAVHLEPPGACSSSLSTEVRRDSNPRRSPTVLCHRRTSKLQATVDEEHRNQIPDGALPPAEAAAARAGGRQGAEAAAARAGGR
eukprot:gene12848-biopygen16969